MNFLTKNQEVFRFHSSHYVRGLLQMHAARIWSNGTAELGDLNNDGLGVR